MESVEEEWLGAPTGNPDSSLVRWVPKALPALAGDLLYYEDAQTRFGRAQIAVLREEESGHPVAVWLTHGVLRREFEKHDPRPGDKLSITYHGGMSQRLLN